MQLVFASHWLGAPPFFQALGLSQNNYDLKQSALGRLTRFHVVFKFLFSGFTLLVGLGPGFFVF